MQTKEIKSTNLIKSNRINPAKCKINCRVFFEVFFKSDAEVDERDGER